MSHKVLRGSWGVAEKVLARPAQNRRNRVDWRVGHCYHFVFKAQIASIPLNVSVSKQLSILDVTSSARDRLSDIHYSPLESVLTTSFTLKKFPPSGAVTEIHFCMCLPPMVTFPQMTL